MRGMFKTVQAKVSAGYALGKRLLGLMCIWGLIFSLVTIGRLSVAFSYDDTLVNSTAAYQKAFAEGVQQENPKYWSIVNQAYDLEKPKLIANGLAWMFRIFGFKVVVIAERPNTDGTALQKEWRHLAPRGNFVFAGDAGLKQGLFESSNFVLFFGDKDSAIAEAKKARVFAVRVLRDPKSLRKLDYRPGSLGEIVLPFSDI
jgi:acid phosphatase class B